MKTARISITLMIIVIFGLWLTPVAQAALNIAIVDDGGDNDVGKHTSLAIVNGFPAISYVDDTNDNLLYVRATDASGTTWGAPQVIDTTNVRVQTKLLIVDGRPAIAYFDSSQHHLKFVRALDANGTAWGVPVTVDNSGIGDGYLSMAIVNGKPAISYKNITNNNLTYVQATNAQGSSWNTPLDVFEPGTDDSVGDISMAIVHGSPAVVFYYFDDHGDTTYSEHGMYVRATDVDGATWNTPITMNVDGGTGFSLTVVAGKPAVAYKDWEIDALMYTRATDATGSAWNTPLILDSDGQNIGLFATLAIVDGLPAVGYVENGTGHPELRFIRAWDEAGATWELPRVIDSPDTGWYSSLIEVDGMAGISYYASSINGLKFTSFTVEQHTLYLPLVIR